MKRTTKEYWVQSITVGDVVQFNENSIKYLKTDFTGRVGIVAEIKNDMYVVGVATVKDPYSVNSIKDISYYSVPKDCIEYIGHSHFVLDIKDSQQN